MVVIEQLIAGLRKKKFKDLGIFINFKSSSILSTGSFICSDSTVSLSYYFDEGILVNLIKYSLFKLFFRIMGNCCAAPRQKPYLDSKEAITNRSISP